MTIRMRISERIETKRLCMRVPEASDLDGWASLLSDPTSAKYIGGPKSRTESWRGLAFEAASAALDEVFAHPGCDEIMHLIEPENARSVRLAERLGAVRGEKHALPPPYEKLRVVGWVQSRAHWLQQRSDDSNAVARGSGIAGIRLS